MSICVWLQARALRVLMCCHSHGTPSVLHRSLRTQWGQVSQHTRNISQHWSFCFSSRWVEQRLILFSLEQTEPQHMNPSLNKQNHCRLLSYRFLFSLFSAVPPALSAPRRMASSSRCCDVLGAMLAVRWASARMLLAS